MSYLNAEITVQFRWVGCFVLIIFINPLYPRQKFSFIIDYNSHHTLLVMWRLGVLSRDLWYGSGACAFQFCSHKHFELISLVSFFISCWRGYLNAHPVLWFRTVYLCTRFTCQTVEDFPAGLCSPCKHQSLRRGGAVPARPQRRHGPGV